MRFRWKLGEAFDGDGLPTELIEEADEVPMPPWLLVILLIYGLPDLYSLPVLFGDGVLILRGGSAFVRVTSPQTSALHPSSLPSYSPDDLQDASSSTMPYQQNAARCSSAVIVPHYRIVCLLQWW